MSGGNGHGEAVIFRPAHHRCRRANIARWAPRSQGGDGRGVREKRDRSCPDREYKYRRNLQQGKQLDQRCAGLWACTPGVGIAKGAKRLPRGRGVVPIAQCGRCFVDSRAWGGVGLSAPEPVLYFSPPNNPVRDINFNFDAAEGTTSDESPRLLAQPLYLSRSVVRFRASFARFLLPSQCTKLDLNRCRRGLRKWVVHRGEC